MTEEQFLSLIAVGRETASLEAKPGGSRSDSLLCARVIRAALGMANHEGGGWIVIGISERDDGTFLLDGVPAENLPGWNHDDVSAMINGVAEPHIAIDTDYVASAGNKFVVIRVHEFVDVPVLCQKNGPTPPGGRGPIYRKDVCYARSRRKPETIEAMADATTWRTLIELATSKVAARVLRVIGVPGSAPRPPSDDDRFDDELADLR